MKDDIQEIITSSSKTITSISNNLSEIEVPVSVTSINTQKSKKESKTPIPNLPSTYVKDEKVSIVNSFLVILFVVLLISGFWIIPNLDINSLVLIKFYLGEFIFNLKLIFDDIAKIIHHIIN